MTKYIEHRFNFSKVQQNKIRNAVQKDEEIRIKISEKNMHGNDVFYIKKTQLNHILKNKGFLMKITKEQLKYNKNHMKEGGFLIPLLTTLAGPLISTVASKISDWVSGKGLYLQGSSVGGCMCDSKKKTSRN